MTGGEQPLPPVELVPLDGVKLGRKQVLDHEAARMAGIAQRLGKRLVYWQRQTVGLMTLPDEEWRECFQLYQRTVMDLLREQRVRAGLAFDSDLPKLTPAEYQAKLRELVTEVVCALPDADMTALVAKRQAQSKEKR